MRAARVPTLRKPMYAPLHNGTIQYWDKLNPVGLDLNGVELITNGNSRNFESNVGDWGVQGTNITIARSTADFHSGVASGLITQTTAGDASTRYAKLTTPVPVVGYKYCQNFWVKSLSGATDLKVLFGDGSVVSVTLTTSWQEVIINRIASGTNYHRLYVASGAAAYYIDDFSVRQSYDAIINIASRNSLKAVQPLLTLKNSGSERLNIYLDGMPVKAKVSDGTRTVTAVNGITPSSTIFIVGDSKSDTDSWLTALVNSNYDFGEATPRCAAGGRTADNTAAAIDAHLATVTGTPTHVLFNLGANDVSALPSSADWIADASYIIDAIHAKWPYAKIYIAYPWRQGYTTECNTLAGYIDSVIALYPTFVFAGHNERVWLEGGDDGATMTTDGVHYSSAGQTECEAQWRAILPVPVWDGRNHLISIAINKTTAATGIKIWFDGIAGSAIDLTTIGMLLFDQILIGSDGTNYCGGNIGPIQIVRFNALSSDGGALIIAKANNRFRRKRQFERAYTSAMTIGMFDWISQGVDISGNGNDLTNNNSTPIVRIK